MSERTRGRIAILVAGVGMVISALFGLSGGAVALVALLLFLIADGLLALAARFYRL